jgi:hypothetical protein
MRAPLIQRSPVSCYLVPARWRGCSSRIAAAREGLRERMSAWRLPCLHSGITHCFMWLGEGGVGQGLSKAAGDGTRIHDGGGGARLLGLRLGRSGGCGRRFGVGALARAECGLVAGYGTWIHAASPWQWTGLDSFFFKYWPMTVRGHGW